MSKRSFRSHVLPRGEARYPTTDSYDRGWRRRVLHAGALLMAMGSTVAGGCMPLPPAHLDHSRFVDAAVPGPDVREVLAPVPDRPRDQPPAGEAKIADDG